MFSSHCCRTKYHHECSRTELSTLAAPQREEVRKLLEPLCGRVTILDDYLPNDFTVLCGKKKHP